MTKKPKCKTCKDTKQVSYRGRTYACGACATDPISVAFRKAEKKLRKI